MKPVRLLVPWLMVALLLASCSSREEDIKAKELGQGIGRKLEENGYTMKANGIITEDTYRAEAEKEGILCWITYQPDGLQGISVQSDIQDTKEETLQSFTEAAEEINGYFHVIELDASHWEEAVEQMKRSGNLPLGWQGKDEIQYHVHTITYNITRSDENPDAYTVLIDVQKGISNGTLQIQNRTLF